MLTKIITGGQTGAEQGGLNAAVRCGIATGGWAPKGWWTELGSEPALAAYGLVESGESDQWPWTGMNVLDSHGTIYFTARHTTETIDAMNSVPTGCRPILFVDRSEFVRDDYVQGVADWIRRHNIQTLNVAGNRESSAPGIGKAVEAFVVKVVERLREMEGD